MNEINPVVERLREAGPALCKQFRLQKLGVFGSFAKNSHHTGSDLDVLYDLEENTRLSYKEYILLEEAISTQTGVAEIDLVRLPNMNPLVWLTVKDSVIYV